LQVADIEVSPTFSGFGALPPPIVAASEEQVKPARHTSPVRHVTGFRPQQGVGANRFGLFGPVEFLSAVHSTIYDRESPQF
jgi:hypothetical protein